MYRHCVTDPPPALISPLVTATMEHAHGHGSAPDHDETRFITMDHGGGGGPVPVAAIPAKPQHRPNLKSGRFWSVFTCIRRDGIFRPYTKCPHFVLGRTNLGS